MKIIMTTKLIPRLIQNSFEEYQQGIEVLKKFQKQGIQIVVSHDPEERIKKILNEKNT